MATKTSKERALQRQIILLKHFEGDYYQEQKVGDEAYVKMWNGGTKRWQVAVFSQQSFRNYKNHCPVDDEPVQRQQSLPFERPTLESIKKLVQSQK